MKAKRFLRALFTTCMAFTIMPITAFAEEASPTATSTASKKNMVALGDSITTGFGLADISRENFVNIVKEAKGYILTNVAEGGKTVVELPDQISKNIPAIKSANVITISIGGNDLVNALFEATAKASSFPGSAAVSSDTVRASLEKGETTYWPNVMVAIQYMSSDKGKAEATPIIAALDAAIGTIRDLNSTAEIVLLKQYNPYLWTLAEQVSDTMTSFLSAFNGAMTGGNFEEVLIADVFADFEAQKDKAPLTNATIEPIDLDFHPNAAGHARIAKTVIDALNSNVTPTLPDTDSDYITYTAKKGDSIFKIARANNSTVAELARINKISDPNLIYVGQKLQIPQK